MSDDESSGKGPFVFAIAATVVCVAIGWLWSVHRSPDGARRAWLHGSTVVIEEFRLDEGDEMARVVVVDAATGNRLQDRDPNSATPLDVVNGKLWLSERHEPYGLEAWSLPDLKTVLTAKQLGLQVSSSNVCFGGGLARMQLTDGRYAVVDLAEGKVVADREVDCEGRPSAASQSSRFGKGKLTSEKEASSERYALTLEGRALGGEETFLEPSFLLSGGTTIDDEGDVFVVHRVQLGEDRSMKLSRVGADAVRWTVALGTPESIEASLWVGPATLVVVGHSGVTAVNGKSGSVLWRTGN